MSQSNQLSLPQPLKAVWLYFAICFFADYQRVYIVWRPIGFYLSIMLQHTINLDQFFISSILFQYLSASS